MPEAVTLPMPRRFTVAHECLAQLLHLPAATIVCELAFTPSHATSLLRQHGLVRRPWAPGGHPLFT
jgi:hypothetical protein